MIINPFFKRYKKSQTVTLDIVFAMVIFILFVTATFRIWNIYSERFYLNVESQDKWNMAFQITDLLVKSPGYPVDWDKHFADTQILGFAYNDRNLSQDKIDKFLVQSNDTFTPGGYDRIKELLNIERYDFLFRVVDISKHRIPGNLSGRYYENNFTVTIRRLVMVDNEPKIIEFSLY